MADKLLSKEQVDAVVQFSEGLYAYDKFGYWSPWLSNSTLQGLNNNPKTPSVDKVREALANYKDSAETIQGYMEYMNFYDMLFARTVMSYVNALSFDLQMVCANAFTQADYQSDEYLADKRRIEDFLNKFNYKYEFRKVVEQIMLHEAYFTWFRKTKWGNKGMKFALQTLPQDRCLLTGYWEKGLLFDFDMSYFLMAGTDLDGYDPAFKKYYNRVFGNSASSMMDYRPTNPLNERIGSYAMWTQTSPEDGAWAFKFNPSNFNTTPFLAPYLKNSITNDEVEQLQRSKDVQEAYAILAGEIATFDNAKSGTQADQMVFNPKTLGKFMSKAKTGLSNGIRLAALPLKNLDMYQFEDKNTNMYQTQLSTSAAVGTGLSRVIYSTDRMSNAEIEAAKDETYNTMKPLYYQFANFMEFYANKLTKRYHFKFIFDGSTYPHERQARFDRLTKVADKGIVLGPSAWASVLGYNPIDFEHLLDEGKWGGMQDKLSLLLNTNIMTDRGENAGRPKSEGIVDESTERNEEM